MKIRFLKILPSVTALTLLALPLFSCSTSKNIKFNIDGTNWIGVKKGYFDSQDYEIDEENGIVTYFNGEKIHSENLVIPDYIYIGNKKYTVLLGMRCFQQNNNILGDVQLNHFISSIPTRCFWMCSGLMSITLQNNLTRIENYAFSECRNLMRIIGTNYLTWALEYVGDYAFYGCQLQYLNLDFTSKLSHIGNWSFAQCWGITQISFFNSFNLLSIGDYAFAGCSAIKYLYLSNEIKNIGKHAFEDCKQLIEVLIPSGNKVLELGDYAFYNCSKLVHFPNGCSFSDIGQGCFGLCSSLEFNIEYLKSPELTDIKGSAFESCDFKSIKIPNNIQYLNYRTFGSNNNLSLIDLTDYKLASDLKLVANNVFDGVAQSGVVYVSVTSSVDEWTFNLERAGLIFGPLNWTVHPIF